MEQSTRNDMCPVCNIKCAHSMNLAYAQENKVNILENSKFIYVFLFLSNFATSWLITSYLRYNLL